MATDTTKITGAADDLSDKLTKGGSAAKTLGAEIAAAFAAQDARITALETAKPVEPPIEPPITPPTTGPTGGLITQFSNAQNAIFKIDGLQYCNNTSTKPYAIGKVDDYTLRFEIRQGDKWNYDGAGVDRALINGGIPPGSQPDNKSLSFAYRALVEPGGANTASFFVTSEWHNSDDDLPNNWYTSPPVAVEMLGDKWTVKHMTCPAGLDPRPGGPNVKVSRPWTSSASIVRNQWYVFEVELKTSLSSGYLRIKCDGVQVVNYTGPLGYGCHGHFMLGLYRETNATTFAAKYKNITTSWVS